MSRTGLKENIHVSVFHWDTEQDLLPVFTLAWDSLQNLFYTKQLNKNPNFKKLTQLYT